MQSILRSLSRICNVFLTKMDVLLPATFSMNSLPDLLLLVNAEHKMLYCLIRILRTARLICCSSMRNRDNAILPVTHYRNSPPDLLLVKPVRKSSSSKLDALLPDTNSWNSPPDLLLLVNAEHKMLYCLIRISGTVRLICCCSSMRNRDNAILSVTYYQYSPPELFSSRTKHRKKGDPMV